MRDIHQGRVVVSKKKVISKRKKSKVVSKTTKKAKAKKKVTKKKKPIASIVESSESLVLQGDQAHQGFQDDKQTSLKRRRTSGQTFTGAAREEKRRVASMEVETHKDDRDRIRAPRRSRNQTRSR
jgi:excinuclease UvrABC ATPase subunit